MLDDPIKYGLLAGLAIALLVAAYTDLKSRRIANWLNGAIALGCSGVLVGERHGAVARCRGAAWARGRQFRRAVGPVAIRAMGGGDVKMLTALALWISPLLFMKLLVMMALVGGLLTVAFTMWHVARRQKDKISIPYGVAIALAGLWVLGSFYLPASLFARSRRVNPILTTDWLSGTITCHPAAERA